MKSYLGIPWTEIKNLKVTLWQAKMNKVIKLENLRTCSQV